MKSLKEKIKSKDKDVLRHCLEFMRKRYDEEVQRADRAETRAAATLAGWVAFSGLVFLSIGEFREIFISSCKEPYCAECQLFYQVILVASVFFLFNGIYYALKVLGVGWQVQFNAVNAVLTLAKSGEKKRPDEKEEITHNLKGDLTLAKSGEENQPDEKEEITHNLKGDLTLAKSGEENQPDEKEKIIYTLRDNLRGLMGVYNGMTGANTQRLFYLDVSQVAGSIAVALLFFLVIFATSFKSPPCIDRSVTYIMIVILSILWLFIKKLVKVFGIWNPAFMKSQ